MEYKVFLPGDTVKFTTGRGFGMATVVYTAWLPPPHNCVGHMIQFSDGSLLKVPGGTKFFRDISVQNSRYMFDLFMDTPPCELGDKCCPGSGCCFQSNETYKEPDAV